MQRRDAIEKIMESIDEELIVCNIGFPSRELYDIQDRAKNFYMIGSMGLASSIGLGLAIAKPEHDVVVIDRILVMAHRHLESVALTFKDLQLQQSIGAIATAHRGGTGPIITRLGIEIVAEGKRQVTAADLRGHRIHHIVTLSDCDDVDITAANIDELIRTDRGGLLHQHRIVVIGGGRALKRHRQTVAPEHRMINRIGNGCRILRKSATAHSHQHNCEQHC